MCFRTSEGTLVIANDGFLVFCNVHQKYEWNSGDDTRWINIHYLNGAGNASITWNGSNIVYGGTGL